MPELMVPLPEYLYLQLLYREGPFLMPYSGPDRASGERLISLGLAESVGEEIRVTLSGAMAFVLPAHPIDGVAVSFDRTMLDRCHERDKATGTHSADYNTHELLE